MTIQLVKNGKPILFDSEDWAKIAPHKWTVQRGYEIAAIKDQNGVWVSTRMHRLILGQTDRWDLVDHINHVKSDNRKINIRRCSQEENLRNKNSRGITKYLGVSYQTMKRKSIKTGEIVTYKYLKATIGVNGKSIYLGIFNTEREAALAYNEAAKTYFGEFANLNKV